MQVYAKQIIKALKVWQHKFDKGWFNRLSHGESGTTSVDRNLVCSIQISLIDQLVKNLPSIQDTPVRILGEEIHWSDRLPTPVFLGFPCGSVGKESACNAGDLGLILALGRSPGEGKGYPLQYSGLENSMDSIIHGVTKSRTRLNDFLFHTNLKM